MPRKITLIASLLFLLVGLFSTVQAQQDVKPASLLINYAEVTTDQSSGQTANIYFTVLDSTGQVVTAPIVTDATWVMDLVGYEANVIVPTTPLNITLVLDFSGSMTNASQAMKDAAISAVNAAPQGTFFSVIAFNEQIRTLIGLTSDKSALISAISAVTRSDFKGGTCLYDATFEAVTSLQTTAASGRRAVVLFTDGKDELRAGRGDKCSQHELADVITTARNSQIRIPIYTIGMTGSQTFNRDELEGIARETGGLFRAGSDTELGNVFQEVIKALGSQRQAIVNVCVAKGEFSGTLGLDANGVSMNAPASGLIFSTTCIIPTATPVPTATFTPQPLDVAVGPFRFLPEKLAMEIPIKQVGDGDVALYRVQIIDEASNVAVVGRFGDITVPATNGVATLEVPLAEVNSPVWVVRVTALDAAGKELATHEEKVTPPAPTPTPTSTSLPTVTPTFTPTATLEPLSLQVGGFRNSADSNREIMTITRSGVGSPAKYLIEITDKATNQIVSTQEVVAPADGSPLEVSVNISDIVALEWRVTVTALDKDGKRIGVAGFNEVTPSRPPTATFTLTATPTLTPTFTPTPIPPHLEIAGVEDRAGTQTFEIQTRVDNLPSQVVAYTIRINGESNTQVRLLTVRDALVSPFSIKAEDDAGNPLPAGKYTLLMELELADGSILKFEPREFSKSPPPTPTPEPGFVDKLATSVQQNPLYAVIFGVVVIAVIGLLFWLLRGRGNGPAYNYGATAGGGKPPKGGKAASTGAAAGAASASQGYVAEIKEDATMAMIAPSAGAGAGMAAGAVAAYGDKGAKLTLAKGYIDEPGKEWNFTNREMPYRIGRGGGDQPTKVTLRDPGVSSLHASIVFSGGKYYIIDENSTNGTFVDEIPVTRGSRKALESGCRIRLGANSEFDFLDKNVDSPDKLKMTGPIKITPPPAAPPSPVQPAAQPPVLAPAPTSAAKPAAPPPSVWEDEATNITQPFEATLEVVNGFNIPPGVIPIEKAEYTMGRKKDMVDLAFENAEISRRHSRLFFLNGVFSVEDMGSGNGTFLDGKQVTAPTRLEAGRRYEIRLGKEGHAAIVRFTYRMRGSQMMPDEQTFVPPTVGGSDDESATTI